MKMNEVKLSIRLIEAGMKLGIGMKRKQAKLLGVPWPLMAGWKERLIDQSITRDRYEAFLGLKNTKPKPRKRKRKKKRNLLPGTGV